MHHWVKGRLHKDLPPTWKQTTDGDESLISSRDNRVIITINPNSEMVSPGMEELSSPNSSGGTLTPERGHPPPPQPTGSPPPFYSSPTSLDQLSSEKESDRQFTQSSPSSQGGGHPLSTQMMVTFATTIFHITSRKLSSHHGSL